MGARFHSRMLVVSPGALAALHKANRSHQEFYERHLAGAWGDRRDTAAWEMNERDLAEGRSGGSKFTISPDIDLWVMTSEDRTQTLILLDEEFWNPPDVLRR